MKKFTFTHGKIDKQTAKRIACIIKLSVFFLLICLQVAAKSVEQKVTLNVQNEKFGKVLKAIELQTSCRFIYSNRIVPVNKPVSISVKDKDLYEVLDILLASFNLDYHKEDGKIIVIFQEKNTEQQVNISAADAPSQTVSGLVTDESGNPLDRVSVMIKGSSKGTLTNSSGYFKIEITNDNATLIFSYSGYVNKEIAVGLQTVINVSLVLEQKALDQVVILAYGNTTKRTTTGAAQTINAKEVMDLPVAQIAQKIQGKFAGVQINQASGKPGQGMKIHIRGQASISAGSDPLYVVDGFALVGNIDMLNPDEIETITVLKDAAATSLYGSRAANGVVLITTKRGRIGKTDVNVSSYYGFQEVPERGRPILMNGTEFAQFKKESFEDLGLPVPSIFQNPGQYGEGYDWYGAMLRTAPIQNHSVSISSGSEKFRTAAVASILKQDGVVRNSNFKRFSLRLNSDFKISEKINAGLNVAPLYSIDNNPNTDGAFYNGFIDPVNKGGIVFNSSLTWPILPYKNPDGTLPLTSFIPGVSPFPNPNWYRSLQEIKNETKTSRLLSNAYITYEPIKGLILKSTINVDISNAEFDNFKPTTASIQFVEAPPGPATALRRSTHYTTWLNENLATYKTKIGMNHNFEILGGYTVQRYRSDFSQLRLLDLPDNRINTIQSASNIDRPNSYSDIQEWSLISYLSRLQYNYKGKYLLAASIRRDGSSKFGSENKWGNFPSISAGWVISDEDFISNLKYLSFLKVRASYGLTGNNNIGNYTHYSTVNTTTNAVFGSNVSSGASVTEIGNKNLGWEKTAQLDVGLDIGLLNDRINLTYDYYSKKTNDFLYRVALPRESGFNSLWSNVGEIKFWGHEFSLSSKNLINDFKWNTNFNISFNKSKVLKLAEGIDAIYGGFPYGGTAIVVGRPINQFFGLVWDGVYKDQADFDKSPKSPNSEVGTIKYKDLDGDGKVSLSDNSDRTFIGNPYPKFIFGLTNSFTYKNFDLGIIMSGAVGGSILRNTDQGLTNLDGVFNVLKEIKDRWRSPQNPGMGRYGKTTSQTGDERNEVSTRTLHKGDYLTVKNITLGYNLKFKNKPNFKSAKVFASIQQAFVFSKYKGGNPEVGVSPLDQDQSNYFPGMDWGAYPVPRTFSFGINVGL